MKLISIVKTAVFCFLLITSCVSEPKGEFSEIIIDKNGTSLRGSFFMATDDGYFPTIVLLQGFPGNRTDVLGLGKSLSKSGINVLTFNYSGTHESEGQMSFDNCLSDISEALGFVHQENNVSRFQIDTSCVILGGYSFGGGMAMSYALRHPKINRVISISGNDWGEYFREYARNSDFKVQLDNLLEANVARGIVRFSPGGTPKEFMKNGLNSLDPALFLKNNADQLAPKHIFLIAGWDDLRIPIEKYTLPLYRALKKENAEYVRIHAIQDNHSLQHSRDELAAVIEDWIGGLEEK